jgi:hypothetical protein
MSYDPKVYGYVHLLDLHIYRAHFSHSVLERLIPIGVQQCTQN